jgi:hypothetical protein
VPRIASEHHGTAPRQREWNPQEVDHKPNNGDCGSDFDAGSEPAIAQQGDALLAHRRSPAKIVGTAGQVWQSLWSATNQVARPPADRACPSRLCGC